MHAPSESSFHQRFFVCAQNSELWFICFEKNNQSIHQMPIMQKNIILKKKCPSRLQPWKWTVTMFENNTIVLLLACNVYILRYSVIYIIAGFFVVVVEQLNEYECTFDCISFVWFCMQCWHTHIQTGKNRTIRFFWYSITKHFTVTELHSTHIHTCTHENLTHLA